MVKFAICICYWSIIIFNIFNHGQKEMKQKIIYECLHCGKKNPENLNFMGANCCNTCLKDLKYYVVYDDEKGFVNKLTIPLTIKSAKKFIKYDNRYKKKIYKNIRIVTFEEYEHLKMIKDIHYFKIHICDATQTLGKLKTELKIKESMLNEDEE